MLRLPVVLLSLALGTALPLSASAQTKDAPHPERAAGAARSGPRMSGTGPSTLLRIEQVRKELNLTDEQTDKVKALLEEVGTGRVQIPNWKSLSEEERKAKATEAMKAYFAKLAKFEKDLHEVLNPEQFDRLRQLRLQIGLKMEGVAALSSSELAQLLGLNDEQQGKIKSLRDEAMKQVADMRKSLEEAAPEERKAKAVELRKKILEIHKESFEKALEVLTPEQREKLDKLKGKPFELDLSALQRPKAPRDVPPPGRID
ncbi:MAG: Spy/CpxP family protein refolding chaperone [Planctomycetaceae bacterium]|nr:Spy/CpxP family protein refolding chaperone [Planctomycetaceae bacterium]